MEIHQVQRLETASPEREVHVEGGDKTWCWAQKVHLPVLALLSCCWLKNYLWALALRAFVKLDGPLSNLD
jgi:hypothetical protein